MIKKTQKPGLFAHDFPSVGIQYHAVSLGQSGHLET